MSYNVLIVEDEALLAMTYEMGLNNSEKCKSAGIAYNGEDAVNQCLDCKPSVVLMDIKLSGKMDGIEAASKIIEKHAIPIIFITSNTDEHTELRARKLNPVAYWQKPIAPEKLCDNIQEVVLSA